MNPQVSRPSYGRDGLSPGIVHIGVGNFHRAHQAVYLDRLFEKGLGHDWALVGAGVRSADGAMRERLLGQDLLTTVVELAPEGHRARITGSMIDFVPIAPDNGPLIAAMAAETTRIVSLTVTEGGYYLDQHGHFDGSHPDMVKDAANPDAPASAFGAILKALKIRRAAGLPPFTVMSCDNLPGNGHVAQNTIVGLAKLFDTAFAEWVAETVAFPNGMVDRITPATGNREIALVAEEFGVDDAAPVLCEPFIQWVLEDNFPQGRPPLEEVGVTFTDQVHAFEMMKIRILNGGHAVIAYPSGLLGITYAHEAMQDEQVAAFLHKVEVEEIVPHVPPVPDTSIPDYLTLIETRFANPDIGDTIRRLCLDGSNRQPKFIVPSVRDNLANGHVPKGLALLSALWCRYCAGVDESGAEIAPNDPDWAQLTGRAMAAKDDPAQWLAMREVYGAAGEDAGFAAAFAEALTALWADGTRAVLARYLSDKPLKG
ncbi:mannitol dehydrogenase family protein [Acidimangrovimonas sediminis]|uniref:mannitol dehydrogenase family protein n=1 Tax=Acidimangrovimonas sediminis TaxID=2056283 RepID=UPI000C807B4E|nr:mannitol dehydrogenase family protein [Acidimangrovimonas sediminis]